MDFGREFTLANGEAGTVRDLSIRFDRVPTDNRCPVGGPCVRDGDAVVVVTLRGASAAPSTIQLHTQDGPDHVARYAGYRVRLVRLEPRPVGEQHVPLPRYRATFIVTR